MRIYEGPEAEQMNIAGSLDRRSVPRRAPAADTL